MIPDEKIEKKIQKMNFKAGEDMQKKIIEDALKAQLKTKQTDSDEAGPNIRRIIMKGKIFKVAAAAVIVITSLVCVQFLTGTSTYAQAVAELRNARTVVFTLITQTNQGNGETVKTDVAYKEPCHLRTTTIDGYVVILDTTSGKMMSIVPTLRMYATGEIRNLGSIDAKGPFESIESMRSLPAKADEELGAKEIDGIVCDGYMVTQGDLTTTVWLNTKTDDLVQVEQKYASAPGMDRVIRNIKFDVVLDDSLFSMTPPEGYKLGGELKSDASDETEETFIEFLQWWAGANVDETFPPMVAGAEIAKVIMDMAQQGKFKGPEWGNTEMQLMFHGMMFVAQLPASSNWRYMGENVKYGDAVKAIFWYQPKDSPTWRVIYGDLSVKDVNEEDLQN